MSTESTPSSRAEPAAASCPACSAPVAADQRYCLHCGARLTPMSSVLRDGHGNGASAGQPGGVPPASPPPTLVNGMSAGRSQAEPRNPTLNTIAGVGVLLLAMGVGVLIGRSSSGSTKPVAAAPQVISVASTPTSTGGAASEPPFNDDWPAEKTGFTVQLETLPQSGTKVSAVDAAKTTASGKGAKDVGALKSEDFSSLAAGSYIIYSGVYTKKSEAEKALPGLKKSFSAAKVIEVSNGSSSPGEPPESNKVGESLKKPAPPSVLEKVNKAKGKSYVQKAKELPNVISTG